MFPGSRCVACHHNCCGQVSPRVSVITTTMSTLGFSVGNEIIGSWAKYSLLEPLDPNGFHVAKTSSGNVSPESVPDI